MTTQNKELIETFLPCFPGFYNTIYQFNDENILYCINNDRQNANLSPVSCDSMKIDYKQYENDVVKALCDIIAQELNEFVELIELQSIYNPKEYNFKNDSGNVVIVPKNEKIKDFIYKNKESFERYLKNNYTSYDGFMSHYENGFESWETDTKEFSDFSVNKHYLGAILEFIAQKLELNNEKLYYSLMDIISEFDYIENMESLENNPSCVKCENVIENKDILEKINQFKLIEGKNPETCFCQDCLDKME